MLNRRIEDFVTQHLHDGEEVVVAMAGFRPLSRSWSLYAIGFAVILGLAASTAAGWPAWVGGGLGGGVGAGLTAWLDQRQARVDHDGKGLAVGLAVTDRRLFVLDLETGAFRARVVDIELAVRLDDIVSVSTEKMQGSALKRRGVALELRDGSEVALIPARAAQFEHALEDGGVS